MTRAASVLVGLSLAVVLAAAGCARDGAPVREVDGRERARNEGQPQGDGERRGSARRANQVVEMAAAGDLDGLAEVVARDPRAVHSKWVGRRKAERHRDGDTPLHLAALKGHLKIVRLLLDHGAEVNATNLTGDAPLHFAANGAIAKVLLSAGARADAKGNQNRTALHVARDRQIAQELIAAGADVHVRTPLGETPLVGAAMGGRVEVARLLMKHGADVNAKGGRGCGALTWAVTGQHLDMVGFLLGRGAKIDQQDRLCDPLVEAVEHPKVPGLAALLIERGAEAKVKVKHPSEPSLLHWAVSYGGGAKIVDILVEAGVPIDGRTGARDAGSPRYPFAGGRTALHMAAERGNLEAARRLVGRGADIQAKTTAGETPLALAGKAEQHDPQELIQGTGEQVRAWRADEGRAVAARNANRKAIAELLRQAAKDGRKGDATPKQP